MNKKISLGVAVAIVIAFVTATFAITMSVSQRIYNRLITNLQDRQSTYALIDEIDLVVRENYYGTVDKSAKNEKMLSGYVDSLADSKSYYLSPAAYSSYLSSMKGEIGGIGVNASFDSASGYIRVSAVFDSSPAASAGIKVGDLFSVIDGEAVTAENAEQLIEDLSGSKLTSVKITYIRDKATKTVSVMMGYSAKSVSVKTIGGEIAHIKIDGFYANTAEQLSDILDSLSTDIKSIIFDVRDTSAGTVEYTAQVLKRIVPIASEGSGALATEIDKDGNETHYSSNAQCISGYSVAVLVNEGTSGCGELFACDLRDFGIASLVGQNTAGNADVQKAFSLSDGSGVVLTVAKVKPYITETFDKTGLKPDIVCALDGSLENDSQLRAAVSYLSNK